MTLESSLQIEFKNDTFVLNVKSIKMEDVYYFFVKDKLPEKALLSGKTLELKYTDTFAPFHQGGILLRNQNIAPDIVGAVQDKILENKTLWFN